MVLVGAQDHQGFGRFVQDDVFADHFGEVAFLQEMIGEVVELGDFVVVSIGPVEGLFERLVAVVGQVFAVDAVGDDEDLHVLEEAALAPEGVALVAVDLVKGLFHLHAAPLQFDLHQGQAVDQQGDVVAVFVFAFDGDLVGDLVLVLAPMFACRGIGCRWQLPSSRLSWKRSRRVLARAKTLPLLRWLRILANSPSLKGVPLRAVALWISSCCLRLACRASTVWMLTRLVAQGGEAVD